MYQYDNLEFIHTYEDNEDTYATRYSYDDGQSYAPFTILNNDSIKERLIKWVCNPQAYEHWGYEKRVAVAVFLYHNSAPIWTMDLKDLIQFIQAWEPDARDKQLLSNTSEIFDGVFLNENDAMDEDEELGLIYTPLSLHLIAYRTKISIDEVYEFFKSPIDNAHTEHDDDLEVVAYNLFFTDYCSSSLLKSISSMGKLQKIVTLIRDAEDADSKEFPGHMEEYMFTSYKQLETYHDAVTDWDAERQAKKDLHFHDLIEWKPAFRRLVEKHGWKLFNTRAEIFYRGVEHRNCVKGYPKRATESNTWDSYTRLVYNEEATAELELDVDWDTDRICDVTIIQCQGKYNADRDRTGLQDIMRGLIGKNYELITTQFFTEDEE